LTLVDAQTATGEAAVNSSAALPTSGSVLGVDVGFSPSRRSSAVCRLEWDAQRISWTMQRFRALPAEQMATITAVAGQGQLQAAAFDGPLRAALTGSAATVRLNAC
jgi:hypothetical protein